MAQDRSDRPDSHRTYREEGLSRAARAATALYVVVSLIAVVFSWNSGAAVGRLGAAPPARINSDGEAAAPSPASGVDRPLRDWSIQVPGRGRATVYASSAPEAAEAGRRWSALHPPADPVGDGLSNAVPVAAWAAVLYGLLWLTLRSVLWVVAGAAPWWRTQTP